ncbi:hypothetical protein MBLNU230_g0282t1 [Neophaeotheca triangularis]
MAMPVIKTLEDCTDFSKTVVPFIPQLYDLPYQIWNNIADPQGLLQLYVNTNPVISAFAFSLALAPIFLIVSEINRNYSQVDRVWSILPTTYIAHYDAWARLSGLPSQRLDNMLIFGCVWSARLTFNYWRKGGYSIGSEDYRWEVLRQKIHPVLFFIFNVLFISTAQSILLFLIITPAYPLILAARLHPEMFWVDTMFPRFLIGLVLLEYFADGQQWTYQNAKQAYQSTAKVPEGYTRAQLERGFLTTGLWRYSRHPNFAAEQAIWLSLYQWACYECETYYNWTFVGAFGYLALFQASTWFTELITSGKYAEYGIYQERVGKFVPQLVGEKWDEEWMDKEGPKIQDRVKQREKEVFGGSKGAKGAKVAKAR